MTDLSGYEARNAEREKIKAAATEGPWERYGLIGHGNGLNRVRAEIARDRVNRAVYAEIPQNDKDSMFVAHARNDEVERDVRELIAMVKERNAENERLRERIAELERDAKRWAFANSKMHRREFGEYHGFAFRFVTHEKHESFAAAVDAAIANEQKNQQ